MSVGARGEWAGMDDLNHTPWVCGGGEGGREGMGWIMLLVST